MRHQLKADLQLGPGGLRIWLWSHGRYRGSQPAASTIRQCLRWILAEIEPADPQEALPVNKRPLYSSGRQKPACRQPAQEPTKASFDPAPKVVTGTGPIAEQRFGVSELAKQSLAVTAAV